jgi:hypothetical protein
MPVAKWVPRDGPAAVQKRESPACVKAPMGAAPHLFAPHAPHLLAAAAAAARSSGLGPVGAGVPLAAAAAKAVAFAAKATMAHGQRSSHGPRSPFDTLL